MENSIYFQTRKAGKESLKFTPKKSLEQIREVTAGLSGADLKAACTEVRMFVIRAERKQVISKDFLDAIDKTPNNI